VYVFLKNGRFGWGCLTIGCHDYIAKITSPSGGIQHGYGASLAISGDGNTIAVLSEIIANPDPGAGIVWVYQTHGTGWASPGPEAAILSLEASTEEPCGLTDPNPPDCSLSNNFTSSVAINGDGSTIVLGFNGAVVSNESRGAAYVFVRP